MTPRLTRREHEVMVLLAHGHTVDTAAAELGLSRQTVRNTITSVNKRLRVTNRYAAFLELGWLTPPER